MHFRSVGAILVVLLMVLAARGDDGTKKSEVRFVPPTSDGSPQTVDVMLQRAAGLEQQNRWSEALQIYQDGVRTYPENEALRDHQLLAQIHFDLNRRYADASYRQTVARTTGAQALSTLADVLNKIQTYHVQTPDWQRMLTTATTSLEIALQNPDFIRMNSNRATPEAVFQYVGQLDSWIGTTRVASGQDVYGAAVQIARQLDEQLGLPQTATTFEMIFGTIHALDPYSAFMTEEQYNETMSQIEGNFVGLGVELKTLPKQLVVVSVIPHGPAGEAGLQSGDLILSVDGKSVDDVGSEVAADLLRGAEGTACNMIIQRDQTQYRATVVRRFVEIPSISEARVADPQSGVAYIKITSFQRTTTRDFDLALSRLKREGMKSLIVDVRGNPGGLLTSSVEIADRFISSGVIVSTKGRNPMEDFVHRASPGNTWRLPLVVLIDENSASASEIFAAAIADHKAGRIVGTRSYGKGSVQGIFPLSSGCGLRLTTAKFYTPSGRAIQNNGVVPDIEATTAAKPNGEVVQPNSDGTLDIALQTVRAMAAQ